MTLTQEVASSKRIASIDLARGLVMIIMALDHVRDYWSLTTFNPVDLEQTDPAWFFTRWITHFCAPVFVFLSGTSAWFYRRSRQASNGEMARFLVSRGIWLILVELLVVNVAWQFGYSFVFVQVIWAIGWSMIFLAAIIWLPTPAITAVGLTMVFGHNLLDGITPDQFGSWSWLWIVLHQQSFIPYTDAWLQGVFVAYPLIPWIGLLAVGYGFGQLFELEAARRDRWLLTIGFGAVALFVLLRSFNVYGEPGLSGATATWAAHERGGVYTLLAFLNTTKYPPSLLFLLMTLGPAIALLPLLERWRGRLADVVTVYGRVPFFFYVLHLPLIHATSLVWMKLRFDSTTLNPFNPQGWPADYSPSLWRAYAVWIAIVVVLYWPCRWFVGIRRRHKHWWLSYL